MRILSNSKWENLLLEADKCDLLCSNCHRENHYSDNNYDNIKKILNNSIFKNF